MSSMSSMSGDGDLDRAVPERTVEVGRSAPEISTPVETIYDAVCKLLIGRGWLQGREVRGPRLSLTAAIDVAVGVDVETNAAVGPRLARSGRVQRHLCELAGAANLVAWNDDGERGMSDVIDLLRFAAVAYPDD